MDMEKGIQQAMAMAQFLPCLAGKGEKEPLLPNLHVHSVEVGVVTDAANKKKVNPGQTTTKWRLPYWIVAGSVMVLTNGITHAGPKYKLIPPEAAAMAGFLCATICFFFGTMHVTKQMTMM